MVTFNGVKATVISATPNLLTVLVPVNAFSGKIQVITPDGVAQSPTDYIIFQPPTLTSVSANEAVPGTAITITRKYFSPDATQDTVTFNGSTAEVLEASETSLKVKVPTGATPGKILLKTIGGQVESTQPFRVWYPPVITNLSPGKGKTGLALTLNGNNFAESAARNVVQFGGVPAEIMQASATRLLVKVPANAPSGKILVQTPGGLASTPTEFTFIPAPVIISFTPTSGNAGTTVIISGTHFNADGQTDTVFFNDKPAKIIKATEISLTVQVPRGVRSGFISVAGAGGKAVSTAFIVLDLKPEDAITIYPNPTKAAITINWFKANFEIESLRIFNAVGKLVINKDLKTIRNHELQLSLSPLSPGMYTIRIQTSHGPVVKRVMVL